MTPFPLLYANLQDQEVLLIKFSPIIYSSLCQRPQDFSQTLHTRDMTRENKLANVASKVETFCCLNFCESTFFIIFFFQFRARDMQIADPSLEQAAFSFTSIFIALVFLFSPYDYLDSSRPRKGLQGLPKPQKERFSLCRIGIRTPDPKIQSPTLRRSDHHYLSIQ